jgi:hypothetical protein
MPGYHSWYSSLLQAGWSRDQIPIGARFSAPIHTIPGTHQACYTLDTGSFFPGVKQPGHGIDNPPPSSAEVKERVGLYLYSPSVLHGLFYVEVTLLPFPQQQQLREHASMLHSMCIACHVLTIIRDMVFTCN